MSFSWETRSAASETASVAPVSTAVGAARPSLTRAAAVAVRRVRPELLALVTVAGTLNLWALQRNGWANEYYSAAVRSMSSSWHNFLFASLDRSGVMSVDKPPLALWVQSLSVRLFGYQPLSVLVPEALMGVASVVLLYDLVRSRFGRVGGFVAGLALATTPITVGISRHNNPDALLVLCCVAALWFAVRGLKDGRLRWIVLAGVCVGLGFETKMGVALVVVPGIVAAWLWAAPRGRGRLHALRQLLGGGVAMVLVGGAWPALVELTPAADRPWISGTSDNRVLSLILEYNGVGRVDGQTGGPAGGGGSMFGGAPGPLRLLNSALGGQAGWLLGFALISGLGILVATRLRRSDPRSGWLIAVGGAFLTTAVLFSSASGIFHPYYVSLLAPFIAALVGAGAAQLLRGGLNARILGPLAIGVGVAVELAVRSRYPGEVSWLPVVLITAAVLAGVALWAFDGPRVRAIAVATAIGALLLAPSVWAVDTLGYATSGTFPAGGPASASTSGPGGGPFGGFGAGAGRPRTGGAGGVQLFGPGGGQPSGPPGAGGGGPEGPPPGISAGRPPGAFGPGRLGGAGRSGSGAAGFGGGAGAVGAPIGNAGSLNAALAYAKQHGGGTIAVASQSSASQPIVDQNADVAGIGGFSGRESAVSLSWLAQEVSAGKIRWVLAEQAGAQGAGPRLPGDTRSGSKTAMAAVAKVCRAVSLPTTNAGGSAATSGGSASAKASGTSSESGLYDCQGRAAALQRAGS